MISQQVIIVPAEVKKGLVVIVLMVLAQVETVLVVLAVRGIALILHPDYSD